jgi:hypothetical protein
MDETIFKKIFTEIKNKNKKKSTKAIYLNLKRKILIFKYKKKICIRYLNRLSINIASIVLFFI